MQQPDLQAELEEADKMFAEDGIPAAVERRLEARLFGPKVPAAPWSLARGRAVWIAGGALAAACAVLLVAYLGGQAGPRGAVEVAGFQLRSASADFAYLEEAPSGLVVTAGEAVLADEAEGVLLEVRAGVELRREQSSAKVSSGQVRFVVERRAQSASPYRVWVSHGSIEVLGTAFFLRQGPQGGEVWLEEGRIAFHPLQGAPRVLTPGGQLSWPLAARGSAEVVEEPPPAFPEPKPEPVRVRKRPLATAEEVARAEAPRVQELLDRIALLRSRGRYQDAVKVLSAALDEPYSARTQERLSFELGAIFTYQLSDGAGACQHWQRHLRTFGGGVYQPEVQRAITFLECK